MIRCVNPCFNWPPPSSPSLLRALIATVGGPFLFAGLLKALQDVLQFTQPILLRELMMWVNSYSSDEPQPPYRGTFIAGKVLLSMLTHVNIPYLLLTKFCIHPSWYASYCYFSNNVLAPVFPALLCYWYAYPCSFGHRHLQEDDGSEQLKSPGFHCWWDRQPYECWCSTFDGSLHLFPYCMEWTFPNCFGSLLPLANNGT